MSRLGADVTALDDIARELDGYASRAERARSAVDAQLRRTYWIGPDADAFRTRWHRIAVGDLGSFSADLAGAAAELRRQAAQQRAASGQRSALVTGATLGATTLAGGNVLAARTTSVDGILLGAGLGLVRGSLVGGPIAAAGAGAATIGGVLGRGAGYVSAYVRNAADHGFVRGALLGAGVGVLVGSIAAGAAGAVVGAAVGALIGTRIGSTFSGEAGSRAGDAATGAATAGRSGAGSVSAATGAASGSTDAGSNGPGATTGALPGFDRSSDEGNAAYRDNATRYGVGSYWRPTGPSQWECTAWANYRWAELRAEYGLGTGASMDGDGGAMASNQGGTKTTVPTLGAMISDPSENHVVIAEEIRRTGNGNLEVRVSEFNYGLKGEGSFRNDRVLTYRPSDGDWVMPNDEVRTLTVANLQ